MDRPIGTSEQTFSNIRDCARCGLRYDWRKSPSSMKMTYCSSLCERADLGFTLEALLKFSPPSKSEPTPAGESSST